MKRVAVITSAKRDKIFLRGFATEIDSAKCARFGQKKLPRYKLDSGDIIWPYEGILISIEQLKKEAETREIVNPDGTPYTGEFK